MVIQSVLRLTVELHLFSYSESPTIDPDYPLLQLLPLAIVFHLLVLLVLAGRTWVCGTVQLVYDGGNKIEVARGEEDAV